MKEVSERQFKSKFATYSSKTHINSKKNNAVLGSYINLHVLKAHPRYARGNQTKLSGILGEGIDRAAVKFYWNPSTQPRVID